MGVDVVCGRISNYMKSNSIHCTYQDDLGRVNCTTDNLLSFSVQLWKKNSDIVIEIQRTQGCAIAMHTTRQSLIQTIQHGHHQDQGQQQAVKQTSPEMSRFLQQLPMPSSQDSSCVETCLEICQDLLNSDLLDQNRLGLESLGILTDPSKTQFAQEVSKQVIIDSNLQRLLVKFFTMNDNNHYVHELYK